MKYIHDLVLNRKAMLSVIVSVLSWIVFIIAVLIHKYDNIVVSPFNSAITIFIIGFLSIILLPILLIQSRMFSETRNETAKLSFINKLYIVSIYVYILDTIFFIIKSIFLGDWVIPTMMGFPGLFIMFFVAELIDDKMNKKTRRSKYSELENKSDLS